MELPLPIVEEPLLTMPDQLVEYGDKAYIIQGITITK